MNKQLPAHAPHHVPHPTDDGCLPLPTFERVKYFYGQMLGVREFRAEQSYFHDKHRLHNRYLHGFGVVCGLGVVPCAVPPDPCQGTPSTGETALVPQERSQPVELPEELCLEVECGLAIDCQGNEIVVPSPAQVELFKALGPDARHRLQERAIAYVTLCFAERGVEPVRPVTADSCGGLVPDCVPSRLREGFCLKVSWERPEHDDACSACERECCDPCLLLAAISWNPVEGLQIDNGVRRPFGLFVTTRISHINWIHGATYSPPDVDQMLQSGLELHFSGEVHTHTLQRGVLEVIVYQGGDGRRADIIALPIEIIPNQRAHEMSTSVTARVTGGRWADRIDPGDRVHVVFRADFVLDRCCRPVDGDHVGGRVPLAEFGNHPTPIALPHRAACRPPEPERYAHPMSGNGTPGGTFESWFFVGQNDRG